MPDIDSRYCRTCGHDFGRLYDEPIQCDVCCGAAGMAEQMQPAIDALRAELAEAREALLTARDAVRAEVLSELRELDLIGDGAARTACSCCRKCGATVPCEGALIRRVCDGLCFCGTDDEEEDDDA